MSDTAGLRSLLQSLPMPTLTAECSDASADRQGGEGGFCHPGTASHLAGCPPCRHRLMRSWSEGQAFGSVRQEGTVTGERPRWDGDARGRGVADGRWIAPSVESLFDVLSLSDWIAEEPETHLFPHLQAACADPGSPWTLNGAETRGTVYTVLLRWSRPGGRAWELRADAFALLGQIAESATYIHQRTEGDEVVFDAVTGMLEGDTHFEGHGHLVQLRVHSVAAP